jgi:hypothetical protein
MTSDFTQIEETIQASVNATVRNIAETDDSVAGAVIGRKTTAHLLINGSFLYRDKSVRTSQSNRRLLARLNATGKHVRSEGVWIVDNETIKGHYKINPPKSTGPCTGRLLPYRGVRSAAKKE